jgi:hypothetical protein
VIPGARLKVFGNVGPVPDMRGDHMTAPSPGGCPRGAATHSGRLERRPPCRASARQGVARGLLHAGRVELHDASGLWTVLAVLPDSVGALDVLQRLHRVAPVVMVGPFGPTYCP